MGLCPVLVFAMLGIPRTLVRTTTSTGIVITDTVSVLVCCSVEMIPSLTLPSFLLQERFGGHAGSGGTFQDSFPFYQPYIHPNIMEPRSSYCESWCNRVEPAPDVPNTCNPIGFMATRDIAVGEQLFLSSGGNDNDGGKDWFYQRQIEMLELEDNKISQEDLPE
jgi:hypothetical protein